MNVLGYDIIGSGTTGMYAAPAQLGGRYLCSASDSFDEVVVWLQANSISGNFKIAIYSDASGPDVKLYDSGLISGVLTTSGAWCTCALSGTVTVGTYYWIIVSCNVDFYMKFDGSGSNDTFDDYTLYPTFNNPYSSAGAAPDNYYPVQMSMYLNKIPPAPATQATIKGIQSIQGIQTLRF